MESLRTKDDCEKALNNIRDEIEKIIVLVRNSNAEVLDDVTKNQEAIRNLQEHLQQSCEKLSARGVELTEIESVIYFPAVKDILSRLQIDTGCLPDMNWIAMLDDAKNNILYYLSKLEDMD